MSQDNDTTASVSGLRKLLPGGVGALLTWLLGQWGNLNPGLLVLVVVAAAVGSIAFQMTRQRYVAILTRKGPDARNAYELLRRSLAVGGLAASTYARWLKTMLGWVDTFFGDASMADRTLFPHAFGLRERAPLWTASAFDRCLLLALIYPVVTILIFWAASGHVGPAEHALGLAPNVSGWRRGAFVVSLAFTVFSSLSVVRTTGWTSIVWTFGAVAGAVVGAVAVAGAVVGAVAGAVAVAVVGAVAVLFGVVYLNDRASRTGWQGRFQSVFLVVMSLACFAAAGMLADQKSWPVVGPLLLFLGLLTLINAPFDWASLGLTRALLRRGLELGGWWPLLLALLDAVLAGGFVALLTIFMVLNVQAFDTLAVYAGGDSAWILPLDALFDGIEAKPWASEYWWIYALLLSTMIPSLVNLGIGGASLFRGMPWLTKLVLHKMPERRAPASFDRAWIAWLLTGQIYLGILFGVAAQFFLLYVVIGLILPVFGFDLLDLARETAAAGIPGRMMGLLGLAPSH